MTSLRQRFAEASKECGLKDIEIAAAAKVSRSTISMIRSGKIISLAADTAHRLAPVLRVNVAWLSVGELPKHEGGPVRKSLDREWARHMTPAQSLLTTMVMDNAERLSDKQAKAIIALVEEAVATHEKQKKKERA